MSRSQICLTYAVCDLEQEASSLSLGCPLVQADKIGLALPTTSGMF